MDETKLAEAIAKALNASGRGNFGGGSSGAGGGPFIGASEAKGFSIFDGALIAAGGKLGAAAVAVEHLGATIGESEKMWQAATNIGVNYNNDIIGLRVSIGQTRMSTEDFFKTLQAGREGMKINITTLGSDMTTATRNFAKLSSDFTTTGFGEKLNLMGYTTQEYNEVLALSISGQKALNIEGKDPASKQARADALQSASNLATEMDKVAKLTGVSREAQRQKMLEDQMDGRYQAQIALMSANGAQNVTAEFAKLQTSFAGSGKATQDFVKNILEGGQLTEKSITFLSATGDAGREVEQSTKNLKAALLSNDAERIKEAQARAGDANAKLQEYVMRKQNLEMVSSFDSKHNEVLGSIIVSSTKQRNASESLANELSKHGIDVTTAAGKRKLAEEQDLRIKASQEGKERVWDESLKDYVTKTVEGSNNTAALIQSQNRVADTEALLYQELGALNKKLGGSQFVADIVNATKNVQTKDGKTTTGMDRGGILNSEAATNVIKQLVDGNYKEAIKAMGMTGKEVITNLGSAAQSILVGVKDIFTSIGSSINSADGKGVPSRDGGTYAKTGSPTEPKDAIVKIHKGETVFSPESTQKFGDQLQKELEKNYLSTSFVTGSYQPKKSDIDLQIEKDKLNAQNNGSKKEPTKFSPEVQQFYELMSKGGVLDKSGMDKLSSYGQEGQKAFREAQIELARHAEAEQKKAEAKEEAKRQSEAAPPSEASSPAPTTATPIQSSVTLEQVNNNLEKISNSMTQLVTYTHDLVDHSDRTARYTKRQSADVNNR
jgi:hypothetical protein